MLPTVTNAKKNFDGNSGTMEVEGALQIFRRSKVRNIQYSQYLGDGDSEAFKAVEEANFYKVE